MTAGVLLRKILPELLARPLAERPKLLARGLELAAPPRPPRGREPFLERARVGAWDTAIRSVAPHLSPPNGEPGTREAVLRMVRARSDDPALLRTLASLVAAGNESGVPGGLYLLLHAISGEPVDVTLTSPLSWMSSVLWVMDDCEPELLVRLVGLLRPYAGPETVVVELGEIAARVPPRRPGSVFADRPHLPAQLAPATDPSVGRLLVCLCGRHGRIGMPVNLFHRWAAETDAHVLYLRAPVAAGFDDGIPGVGSDFPALVEFVRGVADVLEVAEIGVYGNSMGGFASIRLGLDVGARRMISAAGVAGMLRPGVRTLPTAAERQRGRQLLVDRLAPGLRAAAGRVEVLCIFSRENTGDRDDAAALAGLPGVRLSGLERAHHNVGRHLAIDGRLGQLLAWVSGHPRSRWARADHTRREPGTKIVPRRRLRALPGKPLAGGFADPVEAIDRLALADPRARSVLAADGSVDRGTLVAGSWALARRLPADDPSPVAFLGDFAASYVAAMIACRRLRRPFVPLDPGTSVLRMEQVLLSSGATDLVLASAGPRPQFPLRSIRTTIFDWADARDDGDAPVVDRPDEAAFVVYTSGSTGVPKGVAHPPRTAASFAALERGELDLRAGDRVVVVSPPGLVGAPVTSLAALAAGAELLAVGEGRTIGDMIGLVGREQATHLVGYVGLMRALASHAGAAEAFARVRAIQVYGDAVGVEDLAALRAPMMPDGRVCLIYGLTECVTMTLWTPPPDFSAPGGRLPLGLPTDGVELWLDPSDGADEGELLATGPRLMTGYWRDDAATNARFVPHPDDPARRLFATGDIVRLRADGMLDFVGRRDNLVKLRGRRIELEDIEAAARRLPGVTGAGVVARRGARATIDSLALHVAGGADGEAVRSGLAATLADYMVPAHVISGANLPLTATGKIDRVRLGEIDRRLRDRMGEEAGGAEGLWPDPLARRIAAIIADEAGVEVISPEAAAVDAGMDSLQAVNVALRIEKQFAVSIAPEELLGRRLFGDIVGEIAARAMG